jgi:hypothetical protein
MPIGPRGSGLGLLERTGIGNNEEWHLGAAESQAGGRSDSPRAGGVSAVAPDYDDIRASGPRACQNHWANGPHGYTGTDDRRLSVGGTETP